MIMKVLLTAMVLLLFIPAAVFAEKESGKGTDIERRIPDIERRGGSAYGFTAGAQSYKNFFRLGMSLAVLESAVSSGDKELIKQELDYINGLTPQIGSAAALTQALRAIRSDLDKGATVTSSFRELRRQIDGAAGEAGMLDFMRFGEWAEASYRVLSSGKDRETAASATYMAKNNKAGEFLLILREKDLPQGVIEALVELKTLEGASIGQKEIKRAFRAFDSIINIAAQ